MARPEKKLMRKRIVNAYLSSVISISLVLLLTGIAALLIVNARSVSKYLKENMHVSVLLHDEVTDAQAGTLSAAYAARPFVHTSRVVTREEGAEELKQMLGEDFLDVFETSPVPLAVDVTLNAAYVHPDSLSRVIAALAESPLVDEVEAKQTMVETLTTNLARISVVFGVFILLLLFISFVLINNTVRLSIFSRRFTIHTMKMVGATKGYIRAPFMVQAVFQGLFSALLAILFLLVVLFFVRREFAQLFEVFQMPILLSVMGIMVAAGVVICCLSTWWVVGRLVSLSKDELYY